MCPFGAIFAEIAHFPGVKSSGFASKAVNVRLFATFVLFFTSSLLFCGTTVRGDGVFKNVAIDADPGIPGQTAILFFDKAAGCETLVIESTARQRTPGDMAWIIPLPAQPDFVEAISPGGIETIRMLVGPELQFNEILGGDLFLLAVLVIGICLCCRACLNPKRKKPIGSIIVKYLVGILVSFTLCFIAVPRYSTADAPAGAVEVLGRVSSGNYDVTTLRVASPGDLNQWLESRHYSAFGEKADAPLDYYIKNNWVFVVSEIKKREGELLAPHPLKMVFAAEEPVYPMRLTALAGATSLTLFVVGGEPYSHKFLKPIFADRFFTEQRTSQRESWKADIQIPETYLASQNFGFVRIGHPELMALIPSGSWVTRLEGEMSASASLSGDVYPVPRGGDEAFRSKIYTLEAAAVYGLACGLFFLIIAVPLGAVICLKLRQPGWRLFAVAIPLAIAVGFAFYVAKPRSAGELHWPKHLYWRDGKRYVNTWRRVYAPEIENRDLAAKDIDGWREAVDETINLYSNSNPLSGLPYRHIDIPGDYTISANEEGRAGITFYAADGAPMTLDLAEYFLPVTETSPR